MVSPASLVTGLFLFFHTALCNDDYVVHGSNTLQWANITCLHDNCVLACNVTNNGCQYSTIIANASKNLSIECSDTYSCQHLQIISPPSESISIECSGSQACIYLKLWSGPAASAALTCTGYIACRHSDFSVDTTKQVSLTCDRKGSSSYSSGPCYGSILSASQSASVSVICKSFSCYKSNFIVNSTQQSTIKMSQNGAKSTTIEGSDISESLTVECSGRTACNTIAIYCPTHAACDIQCSTDEISCYKTTIHVPDENYYNLNLNCTSSSSCKSTSFTCDAVSNAITSKDSTCNSPTTSSSETCCPTTETIACPPNQECNLTCTGTMCAEKVISAALASSLSVECVSEEACQRTVFVFPAKDYMYAEASSIHCSADNSCHYSSAFLNSAVQVDVVCSGDSACFAQEIVAASAGDDASKLTWLSLECAGNSSCRDMVFGDDIAALTMKLVCGGESSCANGVFSAVNATILEVYCMEWKACSGMRLGVVPDGDYTALVLCETSGGSGGACDGAWLGLADVDVDELSEGIGRGVLHVLCESYDCVGVVVDVDASFPVDDVSIKCNGSHACEGADIRASQAGVFALSCLFDSACHNSSITCPTTKANTCLIACDEGDYVCANMTIHSAFEYVPNALTMSCLSEQAAARPCNPVQFECDAPVLSNDSNGASRNKNTSRVVYNKHYDHYDACVVNNVVFHAKSQVCCPGNVTAIVVPTTAPSAAPTAFEMTSSDVTKHITSAATVVSGGAANDGGKEELKKESAGGVIAAVVIGALASIALIPLIVWCALLYGKKAGKKKRVNPRNVYVDMMGSSSVAAAYEMYTPSTK